MYYLTDDQYDTFYVEAHNLCSMINCKEPIKYYPFLDKLANLTTMLTGKYPEPEVFFKALHIARKINGKSKRENSEKIIEIFIGTFTYDKNRTSKAWYELAEEELKNLLKIKEAIEK